MTFEIGFPGRKQSKASLLTFQGSSGELYSSLERKKLFSLHLESVRGFLSVFHYLCFKGLNGLK